MNLPRGLSKFSILVPGGRRRRDDASAHTAYSFRRADRNTGKEGTYEFEFLRQFGH